MMKERIDDRLYLEKVEKIGAICKDLGVLVPVSFWQFKVEGGEEVSFVSQSFTNNARRLMASVALNYPLSQSVAGIELRVRTLANTLIDLTSAQLSRDIARGGATVTIMGIVVGSSNVAENPEHASLQALIPNGVGAGQVEYQAEHDFSVVNNVGLARLEVTQSRRFLNNSGATIPVNEVGLYINDAGNNFMIIRDQLPATVNIPHAGQLTVTLLKTVPNW